MLETKSEIVFTSALASKLKGQKAASWADVKDSVGLADLSGQAIWHVRGKSAANRVPSGVGHVIKDGDSLIAQARGDQYFVINGTVDAASSSTGDVLTVTDLTHAYGHLLLLGNYAPDVLAKVCGLDFADRVFPNLTIAQSSLAKVRASIIRDDQDGIPAYHILVGYPVTAYVWDLVFDATQEFAGKYVTPTP